GRDACPRALPDALPTWVGADRLVGPLGEPELVEGPGAERAGLLLEQLAGEQEVVAEPAGVDDDARDAGQHDAREQAARPGARAPDRKSTRLNSNHQIIP